MTRQLDEVSRCESSTVISTMRRDCSSSVPRMHYGIKCLLDAVNDPQTLISFLRITALPHAFEPLLYSPNIYLLDPCISITDNFSWKSQTSWGPSARLRGESESFEIAHLPLQVLQNNPSNVWVQMHSLRTLDGAVVFSGMKRAQDILFAWEKLAVLEEDNAQHRGCRRGTSSIYLVVEEASHPLGKYPTLQTHSFELTTHKFTGIGHRAHPASLINDLLSPSKPNYYRISRVPPTTQTTLNIAETVSSSLLCSTAIQNGALGRPA